MLAAAIVEVCQRHLSFRVAFRLSLKRTPQAGLAIRERAKLGTIQ